MAVSPSDWSWSSICEEPGPAVVLSAPLSKKLLQGEAVVDPRLLEHLLQLCPLGRALVDEVREPVARR
eukprot:3755044-Alexandrium_andersonii.AAC.1